MKENLKSFFATIGYFVLVLAIQLLVSVVAGVILGVTYMLNNGEEALSNIDGLTSYITEFTTPIVIVSDILIVLILMLIYHLKKRKISTELLILKTKSSNLIISILIGISVWCINAGALSIVEHFNLLPKAFETFSEVTSSISAGNAIISMLGVVIIAPFAEEFIFRGVIYRTLNRRFSIGTAIIIQGILFGVFHGNLIQGIYATLLGIAFGYVTYKCKSIWPSIICHAVNNGIAMILPMLLSESLNNMVFYSSLLIIGIILFVISIFEINKTNKQGNGDFLFSDYLN